MRKFTRNLAKLLALAVLTGFSLVNHATAMPSAMHSMAGMDHDSSMSSSTRCATLCTSMVFGKKDSVEPVFEEQDDEPAVPFYAQAQVSYLYSARTKNYSSGLTLRPPPKVPIHIQHQVFRV